MTSISMHLTANFYPPIPADIQLSVQEFFDEFVDEADPYILGWADIPEEWQYEISNEDALTMQHKLPNGRIITAQDMLDELRLWDAVWWDCSEPDESYADHSRELEQIPGQIELPL